MQGMIDTTSTSMRKVSKEENRKERLCRRQAARRHTEGRGDVEILLNRREVHDVECIGDEGKERYGKIRGRSLHLMGTSKKWRVNETNQKEREKTHKGTRAILYPPRILPKSPYASSPRGGQ